MSRRKLAALTLALAAASLLVVTALPWVGEKTQKSDGSSGVEWRGYADYQRQASSEFSGFGDVRSPDEAAIGNALGMIQGGAMATLVLGMLYFVGEALRPWNRLFGEAVSLLSGLALGGAGFIVTGHILFFVALSKTRDTFWGFNYLEPAFALGILAVTAMLVKASVQPARELLVAQDESAIPTAHA